MYVRATQSSARNPRKEPEMARAVRTMNLSHSDHELIGRIAQMEDRSKASVVRRALAIYAASLGVRPAGL